MFFQQRFNGNQPPRLSHWGVDTSMARDMIVCGCHQVKMLSPQNSWENGEDGKVSSCNFLWGCCNFWCSVGFWFLEGLFFVKIPPSKLVHVSFLEGVLFFGWFFYMGVHRRGWVQVCGLYLFGVGGIYTQTPGKMYNFSVSTNINPWKMYTPSDPWDWYICM